MAHSPPMATASTRRKAHLYRGLSLDQRQAERRQRLIRSAVELFGRDGYHGTAIRALCVHAGLTERYFYESFVNGEALLTATYEHLIEQLRARILKAVLGAPRDLPGMSRAGLSAFFEAMYEDRAAARIILYEVLGVSPVVDGLYRRALDDFEKLVRQIVETFFDTRRAAGIDLDLIAAGLIGTVLMIASRWTMTGYALPLERVVDNCLLIFNATADECEQRLASAPAAA